MVDFTALIAEAQRLIDTALAEDAIADASVIAAKNAEIAALQTALAACEAQEPPPPPPPPPPAAFPDATNTGVPAGITLTVRNSNLTTSADNQVIQNLDVRGIIIVRPSDTGVTIKNCKARGIFVEGDNCTIQDCDIVAGGVAGATGISLVFSDNCTIQRCDISAFENGIWLEGNGCLIKDNYLHNAIPYNPQTDPHIDGLQIPAGGIGPNRIEHNNIDLSNSANAACMIDGARTITVTGNRLVGGGYTLYFVRGCTGCVITNNVFGGHQFGYVSDEGDQSFSGNKDLNGNALNLP